MPNTLREAIHKKSRPIADLESVDLCDIMWTDDGYQPVPYELAGIRKSDTGIKDIRRWWGMISGFNKREKNE